MKGLIGFLVLMVSVITTASANVGFGVCNYGEETVPSVICYGPAFLKDTTVTGDVKVVGPLTAQHISARSVVVTGTVNLVTSNITGQVNITGTLQANGVKFAQDLKINSDNIVLTHSVVNGSVTMNSSATTPHVVMQCGAIITGSVTFEGMPGVVQVSSDSNYQGKIIHGTMEFTKTKCS